MHWIGNSSKVQERVKGFFHTMNKGLAHAKLDHSRN